MGLDQNGEPAVAIAAATGAAVGAQRRAVKRAYAKYLLALLLFGSNGLVASRIGLNSYEIVLLRSLLGSAFLLAVFFLSGRRLTLFRHKKDALFLLLSGLAMAADWLLLFEAYAQIGVSLGMLINYCGPAIVIALSPVFFKERVTWQRLAALLAALLGVFLIGGQTRAELNVPGLLCAGLSACAYAVMVIFNKKVTHIDGMENATAQLFSACLAIAAFTVCKQGFRLQVAAGDWGPVLWLGLVNTGLSCYLYFSSIGGLPVQTVAICGYLEPLCGVLLAVLFLQERMLPLQILGAALILGGAIFGESAAARGRGRRAGE